MALPVPRGAMTTNRLHSFLPHSAIRSELRQTGRIDFSVLVLAGSNAHCDSITRWPCRPNQATWRWIVEPPGTKASR